MGSEDSKWKYHNKQSISKREAEEYLVKILHEKNTNTFADAGNLTVGEQMET